MSPFVMDPTAGRRAEEIRLYPEGRPPILDPTDPRCERPVGVVAHATRPRLIVDPTDPRSGLAPLTSGGEV